MQNLTFIKIILYLKIFDTHAYFYESSISGILCVKSKIIIY